MGNTVIPFDIPGFEMDEIVEHGAKLLLKAHSLSRSGYCPDCGQKSDRIHSYYTRSPRDTPSGSWTIQLVLRVVPATVVIQGRMARQAAHW